MKLRIGALTDVGRVRKINEDSFRIFESEEYSYGIVADGMGGHQAGEVASAMAVDEISAYIDEHLSGELDRFQAMEVIRQGFLSANRKIYEFSCENERVMGMGTTATLCMLRGGYIIFAHVGDSRAYMIGDTISQITRDHSYVQELVKLGQITPEQAKHHPRRNIITRAMGVEKTVKVDTGVKPYNGERLLLCSDGLVDEIEDSELFDAARDGDPDECVRRLVNTANERGGNDNITAVIMEGEMTDA
ncbi:MAG TPA: Stp1/IreP family PP2C-type Ser/Thr phosphatase [Candidatus Ornithomonoglobus merdipullorum]|uniref:Stp1/IreP family PP2C-type Ser/Thr phosphatase n=1 Tax=Candidatus Ornithomonoglobus merdipullorum TaxID=2840895 RepID=A0A9D1SE84_9FIRM|nr:Stp1/IreP family PP2C-type Ser/Thr phosphatase [Candidatus Ornithomonoglobus merdipullorum]